ncbi:MAG: glutamate-cysteine ligase family protein [Blastocatellia bacterium]
MGEHIISSEQSEQQAQAFMKALLTDISALEQMLERGLIESGVHRIGAEQEMFLVDRAMRPASVAVEVLRRAADPRLTTEIGKFNLEANLSPLLFSGNCLSALEREALEVLEIARKAAKPSGADILLAGILPTLHHSDLSIENLTPSARYEEMNRMMKRLRGDTFNVHIKGVDELQMTHDNLMLEACCTSFQVHLQVDPREFVRLYNLAQLITAPVLAVSVNSPLLLGYRLWDETRIALFQHSVDERSPTHQYRNCPPRVSFGDCWIRESVLEVFREEIARYRVLLTKRIEEDSLSALEAGRLPELAALRLHNGTIWRWNRPCYGVSEGKAHLRIEMRAIPSGPSIPDEIANAAFFLGLMTALPEEYGDITERMPFDVAADNFLSAARRGLRAQFTWLDGRSISAPELIADHLLPIARAGLERMKVDSQDIDRYLGIIGERARRGQTGAAWALQSLAGMGEEVPWEQRLRALAVTTFEQQRTGAPVHSWPPAALPEESDWRHNYRTVEQFMSTDLFTVRPDDLVDLAASVMNWKHVRHVPVEDDEGRLLGLVSHRDLLRLFAQGLTGRESAPVCVKQIMKSHPVTVTPDTPTVEALRLMRRRNIGCLPVVSGNRLVGLLTAQDFLDLSADLIESHLAK